MTKLRVAAIIEAAPGIVLTQEGGDIHFREVLAELQEKLDAAEKTRQWGLARRIRFSMEIVSDGRYSLPGGGVKKIDFENAEALELFGREIPAVNPEDIDVYRRIFEKAVCREVDEELGLRVDPESLQLILKIQGKLRRHLIFIVHAEGQITLNKVVEQGKKEISGIGFLNYPYALPLDKRFFQAHVRELPEKYMRPLRSQFSPHYLSRITVAENIVDDWFMDMWRAHMSKSGKNKKVFRPAHLSTSPNFIIYDADGHPVHRLGKEHIADAKKAASIPPPLNTPRLSRAARKRKKALAAKRDRKKKDLQGKSGNPYIIDNQPTRDVAAEQQVSLSTTTASELIAASGEDKDE